MIFTLLLACTSLFPTTPAPEANAEQQAGAAPHDEASHGTEGAAPHGEAANGAAGGTPHNEAAHGAEGEGSRVESVTLSPEARAAAALVIQPAETRVWSDDFGTTARVQLDPRREARIGVSAEGQVERVLLQPGDKVSVGTVIAEIRSPALGEAVAAYHVTAAERDVALARLARLRELKTSGTASPAQVAEAEAEGAAARAKYEAAEEHLRVLGVSPGNLDGEHFPSKFPVRSPVAGELFKSDVSIGEAVEPGSPLFHVGNLDNVWVILDVFERDLSRVEERQEVRFMVDAWPDTSFVGTIDWVGTVVDQDARTIEVRLVVDNPDHKLKPGMFGRADLGARAGELGKNIILPASAVQNVEGRDAVFVEVDGKFEARPITVGHRNAADVEILSGVGIGEPVVIAGSFTLKSELAKAELGEGHAH